MNGGPDSPLLQLRDELGAINLQPVQFQSDHVEMPRMDAARLDLGEYNLFHIFEQFGIQPGHLRSPLMKSISLAQLVNANCRRDIRQIVFESWRDDLVIPRPLRR